MLHVHHVIDLHAAAILIHLMTDAPGVDAHGGSAEGRGILEGVALALPEDHAAGDHAVPVHDDLVGHDDHAGARALQPGHLRLHIGQAAVLAVEVIVTVRGELQGVFVLLVIALNAVDGNPNVF